MTLVAVVVACRNVPVSASVPGTMACRRRLRSSASCLHEFFSRRPHTAAPSPMCRRRNPYETSNDHLYSHTHTHTHICLTALFPGLPGWAGASNVKTNLDFTEASDSEWQWHQLGHMQVYTSLQADNHACTPPLSFLQAGCPSCRPTMQQRQSS